MARLPGRLGSLIASDVMTRQIVTVQESATLESVVVKLKKQRISGAPVIDDVGKLVGILSIFDLIDTQPAQTEPEESASDAAPVALAHESEQSNWELLGRDGLIDQSAGVEKVSQRMSTSITSVTDDTLLVDVARVMCDGHWHRVPVVDRAESLVGIISTMDVLAAIVNAADEPGT